MRHRGVAAATLIALVAVLATPTAWAVPSFARQTGMACEACHTVFPELTHFGRMFKANGYNIDNLKPVRGITATKQEMLALSGLPPISLMVQVSQTNLSKELPEGTDLGTSQSGTVAFPQQISLFYAGKIAPGVGSFIQLTYGNDSGTVGIDNVDLRWADNRVLADDRSLVYGIDANNNPTVQDLWNSTPAFGYPYASSNAAVPPIAGTQIDGTLGQDVAGLSAYVMWNESLYAEFGTVSLRQAGGRQRRDGRGRPTGWRQLQRHHRRRSLLPAGLRVPVGPQFAVSGRVRGHLQAAAGRGGAEHRIRSAGPTTNSRTMRWISSTSTSASATCSPWPARVSRKT